MRISHNQWPPDGSLPEKVAEFVEWTISPDRQPKYLKDWAAEHDVTVASVHRWRKDKRVQDAIGKRAAELNINPETTQDIVNAIRKKALEGDMKAAALFLQYTERLAPKRVVIQDQRIENLSAEEFHALLIEHELTSETP